MTSRGWHRHVRTALAVSVLSLAACGPVEYIGRVTMGAQSAVEAARTADAAKWSPYWWTRATQYLHKAREEAAYAHFEAANHFGQLSEDAATKAREEALRRAADPAAAAKEMGPIDGGTIEAPAAGDAHGDGKAGGAATHGVRSPKGGLAPVVDDDSESFDKADKVDPSAKDKPKGKAKDGKAKDSGKDSSKDSGKDSGKAKGDAS